MSGHRVAALFAMTVLALSACTAAEQSGPTTPSSSEAPGSSDAATTGEQTGQRFPDVTFAGFESKDDGSTDFEVTVSSPYDTPDRYADAIRVRNEDGTVYGERELTHDHADEQPFTRTVTGVQLATGAGSVVVEARDSANGWGGKTVTVALFP